MGTDPVPSLQDRANALVFSLKRRFFGDTPEWNFCEDSKARQIRSRPPAPSFVCYNSSDPCSYLTWGPRGATADQAGRFNGCYGSLAKQAFSPGEGLPAKEIGTFNAFSV